MRLAFQNMSAVELTFLFWTVETRRIALIAICVATGVLLGRISLTHKQPSQEINRKTFEAHEVAFSSTA
ncbi:MAG: LapA family protein [Nitrospirales bacterium]